MDSNETSDRMRDLEVLAVEDPKAFRAEVKAMTDEYTEAAMRDPRQVREWLTERDLTYGGLIGIGVVMVQPFLYEQPLDLAAKICVGAFAVAIPLLAALILLNRQELFRRRVDTSRTVLVAQQVAQGSAVVGAVAGFWHIHWVAGVLMLVSGVFGLAVQSAGWSNLEGDQALAPDKQGPGPGKTTS